MSALRRAPFHREILIALAACHREIGEGEKASTYLRRLADVNPWDPALARPGQ